jgi:hypothetical protein
VCEAEASFPGGVVIDSLGRGSAKRSIHVACQTYQHRLWGAELGSGKGGLGATLGVTISGPTVLRGRGHKGRGRSRASGAVRVN